MYFKSFPKIFYDSKGDGNYKRVTNLLRRVAMRTKLKSDGALYDTYDVKEGETPESIAFNLYDNAELHWVIMLVNDITDRYHDWPMTEAQFLQFIKDKYDNVDALHHYEISQTSGNTKKKIDIGTDNTDYPSATLITNYEYEQEQQDAKRKIRLLDPSYIGQFKEEFKKIKNYRKTLEKCHDTVGVAILNTSITIVFGFSILMLSNFIPTIYFGVFTGIAMLLAMVSVLTLLPKLILLVKPFGNE